MAQSIPSMRVMMGSIAVALLIAGPNSRLSAQPPSGRGGDSRVVELNRLLVIIASKARVSTIPSSSNPLATVGELVRFVEENGRVTRMITGDSYVERVQP
jgi:hypothetical protein